MAEANYSSLYSGAEIDAGIEGGRKAVRYDGVQILTETQKKQVKENLGIEDPESQVFVATYGVTKSAEIEAAFQANMVVLCIQGVILAYLTTRGSAVSHTFTTHPTYHGVTKMLQIREFKCVSNAWSLEAYSGEIGKNKVQTLNENSTDVQYPSAKAVYDYVNEHGGGSAEFTDEAAIEAMIETDMLPTITDASGAILTDINETVILRY